MSDEFIRCPECGNLNIPGTDKCVFCGAELPKIEGQTEEVETFLCPGCKTELPVTATKCPICGWSKEAEEEQKESIEVSEQPSVPTPVPTPGAETPPVPSIPTPSQEQVTMPETPELPEIITAPKEKQREIVVATKKSVAVTIFIIFGLSILQYGLNFLIGWVSIDVLDPNIELYPTISPNIPEMVSINELAMLLHFLFGVFIGFLVARTVKRRMSKSENQVVWFWTIILSIILVNIGITALIIGILMPRNILFVYITFSTAIYLISSIITLFIPNVIGGFLLYENLNNIFFGKSAKAQAAKTTTT